MRTDVAALYVDPRGPYPGLVSEWWDEQRDARQYAGPLPVVAHPPCGPWGQMRGLCTRQDPTCGPAAVAAVRRWGGVLEHPAGSRLWAHCGLPRPGEPCDAWGGITIFVEQVEWGHACRKPTWLYVVGVPLKRARGAIGARPYPGRKPTHVVTTGPRFDRRGLRVASSQLKRRTPEPFARWLLSLAAEARRS